MEILTRLRSSLQRIGLEPIVWLGGLALVCVLGPGSESHIVICPFALLGIDWCPGCGLGRSIAFLARGDIAASLHAHWLGIPALVILLARSITLTHRNVNRTTTHYI